ncbi:hypothetical protein DFH08DRAFT_682816 [Mycena albidolilacea]|uniref:SMP-30/Gluconolactonase/LRE-like region domain-containing protein n=1 Tax=Mycena albidolilacea TaxID=1033008 RepID=A0AAD7AM31_9AGAR|nr:hypothetical protein DFH08DRAFT_682816 [Mycena albidolilacea]
MVRTTDFLLLLSLTGCVVATFPTQLIYQSPTPVILENIVVRPSSKLLVTSIQSPTLFTLDPGAANATLDEVYTFANSTGLTGIVEYKPDVYAVVTSIFNVTAAAAIRGSVVIWSVDLTSGYPVAKPAARIPQSTLTNGLASFPGHPDLVLASESYLGVVYEVNMRTGAVHVKIRGPALAPGPPAPPAIPIGINGLRVGHDGLLYFTNSLQGTFARVPLSGGAVKVLGDLGSFTHTDLYDDFVFDNKGRAWVATHPGALQLFTPLTNGTWVQETAVGNLAGSTLLNVPTAAAFGRDGAREKRTLYVTTVVGQIVAVDTGVKA